MKVETLTVSVLRSVEQFSNDKIELQVHLDDGEEWTVIEPELRHRAESLINQHWEQKKINEEAARELAHEARILRDLEDRAKRTAERDAYVAGQRAAGVNPCEECPPDFSCEECEFAGQRDADMRF